MNATDRFNSRHGKLLQVRANALTAIFLYSRGLRIISAFSNSLILASLLTPIVILFALNKSIGTKFEDFIELVSYLSSALLLLLSITALVLRVDARKEAFLAARVANNFIANESLELLANPDQDLAWFLRYVSSQDSVDQNNIDKMRVSLRQEAYRESLKQLVPGDSSVTCSVCNASPYKFKSGDCQLCGNTPNEVV